MIFLKRNLFWVLSGLISAGMLTAAVMFSSGAKEKRDTALADLGQYTNVVNRLATAKPYPSRETIEKINRDTGAVQAFTTNAEALFEYERPRPMPGQQFKVYLINSLVKLQNDATNYNVSLPQNFNFTFRHLLPMPNLLPYSIEPLAVQLRDIQEIAQILFESRVHSIDSFAREPAYAREPGGPVLMYDMGTRTNLTTENAIFTSTPYKFSFRGFTTELTEVLNRFARAKRFYIVKKIEVQGTRSSDVTNRGAQNNVQGGGFGGDDGTQGGGGRPPANNSLADARMRAANARRGSGQASPLKAIIDERPLRIDMIVDLVKLIRKPQAQ